MRRLKHILTFAERRVKDQGAGCSVSHVRLINIGSTVQYNWTDRARSMDQTWLGREQRSQRTPVPYSGFCASVRLLQGTGEAEILSGFLLWLLVITQVGNSRSRALGVNQWKKMNRERERDPACWGRASRNEGRANRQVEYEKRSDSGLINACGMNQEGGDVRQSRKQEEKDLRTKERKH